MQTNVVIATRHSDGDRPGRRPWAGLVAVTLVLAMACATPPAWAKAAPDSFADLAQRLLPAVVNVSTTQTARNCVSWSGIIQSLNPW